MRPGFSKACVASRNMACGANVQLHLRDYSS
jgi:hypothetical protein